MVLRDTPEPVGDLGVAAAGPIETVPDGQACRVCRFDAGQYGVQDSAGTLRAFGEWWRLLLGPHAAHPVALAAARAHLAVLGGAGVGAESSSGAASARIAPGAVAADVVLAEIEARARRLGVALDRAGVAPVQVVLHDGLHRLRLVGRALAADGCGVAPMRGTLVGIHAGGGGVPKPAYASAVIGVRGVRGDRQAVRRHHGRAWQALCLWSDDVMTDLAAEGHPVGPGDVGENLRFAGLDWARLRPGARLRIGDDVVAEVTMPAEPCRTIAAAFAGREFRRIAHDRFAGVTRWYASVVADGSVAVGDGVAVES